MPTVHTLCATRTPRMVKNTALAASCASPFATAMHTCGAGALGARSPGQPRPAALAVACLMSALAGATHAQPSGAAAPAPAVAASSPAAPASAGPTAAAQAAPVTVLPTMVVTASAREQQVRSAPASISVIGREALAAQPGGSVAEAVARTEGVHITGSTPNDRDISLRGMPGEYTLLLVNGQRVSTRETMNRGTGGVQSQLLPPMAAIERVEVVRGPMSSLYGADAMGGVVNVITKAVPKRWSGSVGASAVHQTEDKQGDSHSLEFWAAGPLLSDTLGLQLSGRTSRRDEDDIYYTGSATSGANGQRNDQLNAALSWKPDARQTVRLDAGTERLDYIATPGLSLADTVSSSTVRKTRHSRDNLSLSHEGRWDWGRSKLQLASEEGTQEQWTGAGLGSVAPTLRNTTLNGQAVLPWGDAGHVLTLGAQLERSRLNGVASQDAVPSGYATNPDTLKRDAWALYGENDFALREDVTLTTGLRLDHDSAYGSHVSPRVYGVWQLDGAWSLRGGLATGFKAPTLRQSTEGYCMTTGGAVGATPGTLCGNPDLEPETSFTQELGLRHDLGGQFWSATLFNNRLRNKVASYDTGEADPNTSGRNIYVYDNIAHVRLYGLELGLGQQLLPTLRLSGSYTFTQSKRGAGGEVAYNGSSLEGRPLDKTPKHMLNLRTDWQASADWSLYGALKFNSKQYWAAFRNGAMDVRERPASTTFDLGASYAITPQMGVKLAVLNVTNKQVPVDDRTRAGGLSGNWTQDEGRRVAVSLNADF